MPALTNEDVTPIETIPETESSTPVTPKAPKSKTTKPAVKKAAHKAEKPKATKSASAKIPATKKEKTDTVKKDRSMSDLTPVQRAAKILGAMRKIAAVNAGSAIGVATIATKAGLGEYEVYCAVWNKGLLQSAGYVKQVKVEGVRGSAFHLTAKGQKGDPE